jgi:hypothetical protein
MRGIAVFGGLLLSALGQATVPAWLSVPRQTYKLYYQAGYEADRDFAQTWLDRTDTLMRSKYGVTDTGHEVSFYLYTTPNTRADVGLAQIETTNNIVTIHYLAPSAPPWKATTRTTSLGFPYDENFHAKVIISEYIPLAHRAVQATRTGGWRYYDAPSWVSQGLQEYDGFFHSTDFNRTTAFAGMRDFGKRNPSMFACCKDGLPVISDTYNGGALFMAYLAERFGEDIHARLLRSTQPTFAAALADETGGVAITSVFQDFQRWLNAPQR